METVPIEKLEEGNTAYYFKKAKPRKIFDLKTLFATGYIVYYLQNNSPMTRLYFIFAITFIIDRQLNYLVRF